MKASGSYPAAIACHLTDPSVSGVIDYNDPKMQKQIRVTERQNVSFITGIRDGAVIGYKYFEFCSAGFLGLELRGQVEGTIYASHSPEGDNGIGAIELSLQSEDWLMVLLPIEPKRGTHPLYLHYEGTGAWELKTICFFAD